VTAFYKIKKMKRKHISFLIASSLVCAIFLMQLLTGCQANNTTKGGAIGAGVGGAIGGVIGHQSDNTAVGAIIGATVGGATGALIGREMDKQAEELKRDLKGAEVERVGEGIKITFDSGLMFNLDSYELKPATRENLTELSKTLQKYDDTNILIEGHTDNTGTDVKRLIGVWVTQELKNRVRALQGDVFRREGEWVVIEIERI